MATPLKLLKKGEIEVILDFISACADRPDERSSVALLRDLRSFLPYDYNAVLACNMESGRAKGRPKVMFQWCGGQNGAAETACGPVTAPCGEDERLAHLLESVGCGEDCVADLVGPVSSLQFENAYRTPCRLDEDGSKATCLLLYREAGSGTGKEAAVLPYVAPHLESLLNRLRALARTECFQGTSPCGSQAADDIDAGEPRERLTPREMEVLRWVGEGKSNWEIGLILSISERTVKYHLGNIFRKLDVLNRSQAIASALKFGWL